MRERAAAIVLNGTGTLAATLLQVVRTKLFAVVLGLQGMGLIAQITAVQSVLLSITPLFSGTPLVARLALARERSQQSRDELLAATRGLALVATACPAVAIGLVAVMSGTDIALLIAVGALGTVFAALVGVEQAGLQEAQLFFRLQAATVLGSVAGLAVVALLTYASGIAGAVVGVTVGFAVTWLILYLSSATRFPLLRLDPRSWREVAVLSVASLAGGVVGTMGLAALRPLALAALGPAGAGTIHTLSAISLQLSVIAAAAFTTYAAPKVSAAAARGSTETARQEIAFTQVAGLVVSGCVFIAVSALAEPIVSALLTEEFHSVARLLPAQLAGELFLLHAWLTGTYLLPFLYRWAFVAVVAVIAIPRLLLTVLILPAFGIAAFPIAHIAACAVGAAFISIHARRAIGLDPRPPLMILALATLGVVLAGAGPGQWVAAVALVGTGALYLRRSSAGRLWAVRAVTRDTSA